MDNLLCTCVLLPLLGVLVLAVVPGRREGLIRGVALALALAELLLCLLLWLRFDSGMPEMQFVARYAWIPALGIHFHLGLDGFSLLLIVLTALLAPLAVLSSWGAGERHAKGLAIAVLLITASLVGAFAAQDLFLFYAFFEFSLLPLFLLVGGWGGERRVFAAVKLVLHSLSGSLLMLVAILYLANFHREAVGTLSFDLVSLYELSIPLAAQKWLFLAFFVGFAVRVPLVPLHTWLPETQTQAPTAGSVMLAGTWVNVGAYGLLRFCLPLFPEAFDFFQSYAVGLAVLGVLYGGLLALVQTDLRRLVACASVSQMGLVVLGVCTLNAPGLQGSAVQMVSHGLSAAALFLLMSMVQEGRETAPGSGPAPGRSALAACLLVAALAVMGVPGLSGFVGEFLILVGALKAFGPGALVAALGGVLAAAAMLRMFQRAAWRTAGGRERDLRRRQMAVLLPLILGIAWIGVYPRPLLNAVETSVDQILVLAAVEEETAAAIEEAEPESYVDREGD